MGLLHKNLILASVASVAIVGLLGSSSVSALDGFLFSDIINQQQAQREQLLSYLSNPFGMNTDCEATNPDSTISCNESPSPSLLFNRISDGEKLWGHDGKGVVFADSENLINGNPQLKTAKRGDTLTFSVKLEAEDYYDAAETDPITEYEIAALLSKGLTLDQSSISVKIGDQELAQDQYELSHLDGASMGSAFQDFSAIVGLIISIDGSLGQLAGKTIELSLSATIDQDAPSEIFVRSAYAFRHQGGLDISETDYMTNETYQAKALLDGNILIRRVDADGNPLAGARYTVDGVKANVEDETNNIYAYDENGAISEFTTNGEGRVIIKGVPMGEYTVKEVQTPQGHETKELAIIKPVYEDLSTVEYGSKTLELSLPGEHVDLTGKTVQLADGRMAISSEDFNKEFSGSADEPLLYLYDESSDRYVRSDGNTYSYIAKYSDAYNYHYRPWYGGEWLSGQFTYDSAMERHLVFERFNPGWVDDMLYLEFNGDEAIAHTGSSSSSDYHMTLSNETGCYEGEFSNQPITMCKDGDMYRLELESSFYGLVSMPFIWRESVQRYVIDYDMQARALTILSDTELSISTYLIIEYSPAFDYYCLSFGNLGGQFVLNRNQPSLLASEFLFQDKATVSPENIPNPQTSDTLTKAACVILATTTSAYIIGRKLSRR